MKKLVGIIYFCFLSSFAFSEDLYSEAKVLYDFNSSYYDDIYLACMENGIALLSYKKPISIAEIILSYNQIETNNLSPQALKIYERLNNYFYQKTPAFSEGKFGIDYNVRMALEARYLSNPDIEPKIDKLYRYNKSLEPLSLPVELYLSKYAYTYFVPIVGKNFSGFNLSYPYTNFPLSQKALDYHFPKNAGIAIGNKFFNINVGRGRMTVGRTLSGSMLISDSHDRLDFVSASLFFKRIKTDLTIAELSPTSFFISHEISIRPVKQISVTIHEGIMLDSVFDPKFLNPFMIFHNFAAWKQPYINHPDEKSIGCQLGLDINIVPIKNLRIYGQFGMNQLQTPSELKGGATDTPNSMGGIAGIEYILPIFYGHLIFSTEFMYADPWLYIGKAGTAGSFIGYRVENVYVKNNTDDSRINYWLANPYGPDTITTFFKVNFISQKKYQLSLCYRFLAKGENEKIFLEHIRNGKDYYPLITSEKISKEEGEKMAKYKTPSGSPLFFHTLKIEGKYNISKGLDLKSEVSWTIAPKFKNPYSIDFNTAISYSIR